jgi:hypothetical protein
MAQDKIEEERARAETGGVGDVETAGETTAAAAINGPVDARPVGADTMVEVEDSDESKSDNDGE